MTAYAQIKGGQDFARVQRQLKEAGDKAVKREFHRGLNRSVKPLKQAVKDGLEGQGPKRLPTRYAQELAEGVKITTSRRASGSNPSIRLVGKAKTPRGKDRDLASLDRGRLRHPLYGNRRHWFNQTVPTGWWTDVLNAAAPRVRKEIQQVLDDISKKLK